MINLNWWSLEYEGQTLNEISNNPKKANMYSIKEYWNLSFFNFEIRIYSKSDHYTKKCYIYYFLTAIRAINAKNIRNNTILLFEFILLYFKIIFFNTNVFINTQYANDVACATTACREVYGVAKLAVTSVYSSVHVNHEATLYIYTVRSTVQYSTHYAEQQLRYQSLISCIDFVSESKLKLT